MTDGRFDPRDPLIYQDLTLPYLERIAIALERIADALESAEQAESRATAIHLWSIGQGRHPDD